MTIFTPKRHTYTKFDHTFLLVASAVFCTIELIVLFNYSTLGDLAVEADFLAEIAPAAQRLAIGEIHIGDYPFKGPISAMIVALLHGITAFFGLGLFRTGNLLSLLAAVATLWCVYRIGMNLWGRKTAVAAVLLTGSNNVFFTNAHKAESDLLFLALVMASLYLASAGSADRRRLFLLGSLTSVAFLTRYIGIALPLWLMLSILILRPKKTDRRAALIAGGWLGLGFVTVIIPWLAFNFAETGSLLATRNLQNVVQEFYPTGGPSEGFDSLKDLVSYDFVKFLTHYLSNLIHHVQNDISQVLGWAMTILSGAGLIVALVSSPSRSRLHILGWGPVYASALGFVFYLARFSLPLVPLYALLAASLLDRLPRWATVVTLALMGFTIHFQAGFIGTSIDFYRAEQPQYLEASIDYLRVQSAGWDEQKRPRLMARKPHAAWYGRMKFVPYPGQLSGAADLLAFATEAEIDFLIVGQIEHRFYAHSEFLERLGTYRGVSQVFRGSGNTIYRLDKSQEDAAYGTADEIVQLQVLWNMALRTNNIDMVKTIGSALIRALDQDGRFLEARKVAMRKLEFTSGDEALVVCLYVAVVSLKLGDSVTGIEILEKHVESPSHKDPTALMAKGYLLLGQLYIASDNKTAALNWLNRARTSYEKLGMEKELANVRLIASSLDD